MGIINATPDSFYPASRMSNGEQAAFRVEQMLQEGASIIDVGAYSSRPGAEDVSEKEEILRLRNVLPEIRQKCPNAILSIDTFRSSVAKMCVEEYGAAIINDISAGQLDGQMFTTAARLGVPYVLMHMKGTPQNMQVSPHYNDLMKEIFLYFAEKIQRLRDLGVVDIILDPGFGFGKTLENNYEILNHLEEFHIFQLPLMVAASRKSMIYKLLGNSPFEALNGTSVINTIAMMKGAHIFRVHDVKACAEALCIVHKTICPQS